MRTQVDDTPIGDEETVRASVEKDGERIVITLRPLSDGADFMVWAGDMFATRNLVAALALQMAMCEVDGAR